MRIEKTTKLLDRLLKLGGKQYLCGEHLTIADLLVYFEYTDLLIYDRSYPDLKFVNQWAARVEAVPEVEAIMKEFKQTVDAKRQFLMSIRPPQSKL
jgi:glutathione S-transferase